MSNNLEIRTKFLNAGIPYDDIDIEMLEIIDILNFKMDLKTKFCCYGHASHVRSVKISDFYIAFDPSVSDSHIDLLIKSLYRHNIIDDYTIDKTFICLNWEPFISTYIWEIRFPKYRIINMSKEHVEWYYIQKQRMMTNLLNVLKEF